ncbi:MAG: hypothetical protein ABFD89_05165 [Bryobacteraceae bacterium]
MGDDQEFLIRINGDAGGLVAAGKQGAGALKEVKAEITDWLNPAFANAEESTRKVTEATGQLDISHRALRFGMHQLGPEAAMAGHALLYGLANPTTAAAIAVGVGVGAVLKHMEKLREAGAAAPNMSGFDALRVALGAEGLLKAFEDGTVAAEEFWGKLDLLARTQTTRKQRTDDAVESINKQTEAENGVLAALEKSEQAKLRAQRARGELTEEDFQKKKAEIEDKYAGQRETRQEIAADRVIEAKKKELEGQRKIVEAGPDVVVPKQVEAAKAKGALAGETAELAALEAKLKELRDYKAKYGEEIIGSEAATKHLAGASSGILAMMDIVNREPGIPVGGVLDKQMRLMMSQIEQKRQGTIPKAEVAASNAQSELDAAQKKLTDAQNRVRELDREIAKLEEDKKRKKDAQVDIWGARKAERDADELARISALAKDPAALGNVSAQGDAEAGRLPAQQRANPWRGLTGAEKTEAEVAAYNDMSEAAKTAQAVGAGASVSSDSQRKLMEVAAALAGHQVSFREAVAMLSNAGKNIGLFTQDVFRLAGVMGELATGHSALQGRVASLEQQIRQIKAQARDSYNH